METYEFSAQQFLHIGIQKAWEFFSDAENLSVITPPQLQFKILTPVKGCEIYEGMLIDYKVRPLLNIPLSWQTEISKVEKPYLFVDKQLKGPYKTWEHTHRFIEKEKGTLMQDSVKYSLPFGMIGKLTHSIMVREKIENIFAYRRQILNQLFNGQNLN
ncbi:MAG TPA: SRPBCC family protein [Hanamia sp.]|nr:SRPBCC family protein [Hanamia sp.]